MDRTISRVLVVDDKIANRQLMRAVLATFEEGYAVSEADSGPAALEAVKRDPPDIIFLDVMMPDMDGYEVCRRIKADVASRDIPVLFITALDKTDDMIKCFAAGAVDYIVKPINAEEVKARLRVQLNIRRNQKAIRESEARYRAIAMYSSDWEILIGVDGRPVWMNAAVVPLTGYSVEQALGLPDFPMPIIHPDDAAMVKRSYADAVGGGRSDEGMECRIVRKDGTQRWAAVTWQPVYDSQGLLTGHRTSVRDITAQKNTLATMDVMKRQLVQADKLATLGEMATGLAHEINQPLGGIALIVALLRKMVDKKMMTDDKLLAGLGDIETSIKRMTRTVNHLRVYARREEPLAFCPVDVAGGVESALGLMSEQLRSHGIELVKTIEPGLPAVLGDPHQLEQIWINFISNARDSMDEKEQLVRGGKLALGDYHKRLTVTVAHVKPSAMIEVSFMDNGMGAGEEEIHRAFEAFFTTKPEGKGTGLGLSISKGIVEKHQGRIAMEGRKGEYAALRVSLPVAQVQTPQ